MKKTNLAYILIVGLLLVTTIVAIGFYASRPQAMAAASDEKIQQNSPDQGKTGVVPVPKTDSEILSQTQSEVTVEISSAKRIDTGVEIGICYTTLDGGDWYPVPGHLFYDANEVFPDEYEFTTEQKADANNLGKRCALVRYRIDDLSTITMPIKFSMIGFDARPQEMYSACQNFQHRLDTNPKAKAHGLKAKCDETDDGNIIVTLVDNDKSVKKEDAGKVLDEIATGAIIGSWEFTINQLEK